MTMTPFTCDDFSEQLAGHLERDTSRDVDAAMASHAATCDACRMLLQELTAITSEAAALPELAPSRDLWSGIAERIDAPVIPIAAGAARRAGGAPPATATRRWWTHPALAAAALVGITAGATYYMTKQSIEGPVTSPAIAQTPTVGSSGATVDAIAPAQVADANGGMTVSGAASDARNVATGGGAGVASRGGVGGMAVRGAANGQRLATNGQGASTAGARAPGAAGGELQLASYRPGEIAALDSLYYREIIRLRQLLNERSAGLDSSTVTVINRNMLVIDRAIQECREALAADPASKFLNQQLNQALETKIELLRTAAMMPVGS
jgi:hypothetical protein